MNEHRILADYSLEDPLAAHLLESARRLERVVELAATVDGLALQCVLAVHSIRFRDAFATNDNQSLNSTISWHQASAVVAAIATHPANSADWWNNERFVYDVTSPEFNAAYNRLLDRIRANADVAGID
jgi:hypothetical protein